MDLYVGLDVGLEETSVCVIDGEGRSLRELKVPTDPDAVRAVLAPQARGLRRVGVEDSSLGLWLYRELHAAGLPMVMAEAHHMHVSLSTMRNKTDRNDARGIAQMMRLGWFKAVHVKSVETQRLGTLLANRKLLKRKLVDLENHIRGALRAYGLLVGPISRGDFDGRVRELLEHVDYVFVHSIEVMLEVRRSVLEGFGRLEKVLLQVVRHDPVCRRLMSVPGVGPVTALAFRVGVDDPRRFRRSRTVGAHFGLTPRRWQSGTIDQQGRITKRGDPVVRGALCEAAASLLTRVKRSSALRAWGLRIARKKGRMCAIVAVARKLAAILHRMWLDGADFQPLQGAKITEKLRLQHAS
jgi:transposase